MLKYSERVSHCLRNLIRRGFAWSNTDIQFSWICLSNQPMDGLKVTTVTIQQCRLGVTMAWFPMRSKKQQAGLNLCSFIAILSLPSALLWSSFFQLDVNRYDLSAGRKQISPLVVLFPVSSAPVSPCWCCWLMLSGFVWCWQRYPHSGPLSLSAN